jgi:hypothetical protein
MGKKDPYAYLAQQVRLYQERVQKPKKKPKKRKPKK